MTFVCFLRCQQRLNLTCWLDHTDWRDLGSHWLKGRRIASEPLINMDKQYSWLYTKLSLGDIQWDTGRILTWGITWSYSNQQQDFSVLTGVSMLKNKTRNILGTSRNRFASICTVTYWNVGQKFAMFGELGHTLSMPLPKHPPGTSHFGSFDWSLQLFWPKLSRKIQEATTCNNKHQHTTNLSPEMTWPGPGCIRMYQDVLYFIDLYYGLWCLWIEYTGLSTKMFRGQLARNLTSYSSYSLLLIPSVYPTGTWSSLEMDLVMLPLVPSGKIWPNSI